MTRTIAALGLALSAQPAVAASYDPDLTWRTITTEHFEIHFHQGIEQVADEFSHVVEDVWDTMTEEMRWEVRGRTQVVLVDRTDDANGYASVVPYAQIVIFVTAPTEDSTLNLYEDWSEAIFTHELTHVLHMDTNHGIVRLARSVIGRIASTNDVSPPWMIEGLATFQETRHTSGGRGRAAWPDMVKRTAVLEDDFPPLGNLDGLQPEPPAGNLRYLFGQDFIQYVSEQQGEDVWTRWTHMYGGHVPYVLPAKRVFGRRLVPLYFDWRDHLAEKYHAQAAAIRAEGETKARLVSGGAASCIAPSFSPDGEHLVWSCSDLKEGSSIWMSDGDGYAREVLLQDFGAGSFTWRADGQAFVYAGSHVVNQFNVWSDIYMHTLGGGTVPLTQGSRARDPDFSPDGSRLLYVTNRAQNNQLATMTVDRRQQTLTDNADHTQYATPRFSPDGKTVAVSVWQEGRRDLWLYTPDGEPIRRLTADRAIDTDPVWSADGRWLYFASDRTGVYNVYAIDLQTEHLWQVTNVVTGAIKPTIRPDGKLLAYQQYSADGWDVYALDVRPEQWLDRGALPRPSRFGEPIPAVGPAAARVADASGWQPRAEERPTRRRMGVPFDPLAAIAQSPSDTLDTFEDANVDDVFGEEQDYPFDITPHRYNPLPTLRPRYILPFVQSSPYFTDTAVGPFAVPHLQATIATSASDALRHFAWSAYGTWRTDAGAGGGGLTLTYNRFIPVFTVGASSNPVAAGRLFFVDPEAPLDENGELALGQFDARDLRGVYWERRSSAYAQVSWPYKLRSTMFARYSLTDRSALNALRPDVYLPLVPLRGRIGALSGGWRYSWAQQTPYAISREDARIFSLVGSLLHPWLGTSVLDDQGDRTPLTQVQLTSEIREYVVNPLIANHVLALRAAGGLTFGANQYMGNYQLGGSFGDSAFYATPEEFRMLRGYPFGADFGDMYWLGSAEYRFPIWYVNRGVGTIPAFARNVSGAVFVDAGNAFNSPAASGRVATGNELLDEALTEPLVGVGAEISFSTWLGWGLGLDGRLGYGIGLTGEGYTLGSADALYFQLGGSF